jgi:hypothetical protein
MGPVTANGLHLPLSRRWTTGSSWDTAVKDRRSHVFTAVLDTLTH